MNGVIPLTAGITILGGQLFDYNNPQNIDITPELLSVPLSNNCRFAGWLPFHYSIAQHLWNTAQITPKGAKLTALCHDTSEAFTNDIATPLKTHLPIFKELEIKIESAMAEKLGFQFPYPESVKLADKQMLGLEMRHIKGDFDRHEVLEGVEYEHLLPLVDLTPWTPRLAKQRWLDVFYDLKEEGEK